MSEAVVREIVDRYVIDEVFRSELRADPETAIQDAGFELDDEERSLLRSLDFSRTDEELRERMAAQGNGFAANSTSSIPV